MALADPLDLLDGFPGWSVEFDLMARQEQSRHASGRTRTKDLGSPLWRGVWQSRSLSVNELDHWRALLSHAEKSQVDFFAWASSRCRPIKHPGADELPSGTLQTIGDDNATIRVAGLFGVNLTVGDFLQVGTGLHRVLEPVLLGEFFTIEPHLWPDTTIGQAVHISKPTCRMAVLPGSISASGDPRTGRGNISFSALEMRG